MQIWLISICLWELYAVNLQRKLTQFGISWFWRIWHFQVSKFPNFQGLLAFKLTHCCPALPLLMWIWTPITPSPNKSKIYLVCKLCACVPCAFMQAVCFSNIAILITVGICWWNCLGKDIIGGKEQRLMSKAERWLEVRKETEGGIAHTIKPQRINPNE